MIFQAKCLPTTIGSLPHTDVKKAVELILKYTPGIPAWPQLPKRPNERMIVQFTENIRGAGSLTEELAVRALQLTSEVSKILRINLMEGTDKAIEI